MSDDGKGLFAQHTSVPLSNGKAINIRALGIGDYAAIEQEALSRHRRDMIKTWTENQDLIPEAERTTWIREAFERAEKIGLDDLPTKKIVQYHPDDADKPEDDRRVLAVVEGNYANYWMGQVVDGQIYSIWLAARHGTPGITIADIDELFLDKDGRLNQADLEKVADELGRLSKPKIAGNGEAPPSGRRGRRRRNR